MSPKYNIRYVVMNIPIVLMMVLSSCASKKDIVYFQDEPLAGSQVDFGPRELVYKPDDILTINVSSAEPKAAQPFNLAVISESDDLTSITGSTRMLTYLIDYAGNIEFPTLGTIRMAGLTRTEATAMLKEKISEYVKDPIVNIRLVNFTVTVIGEVSRPGTFTIQDERITLPEALGLANDLTIYANRKNVMLIREIDGEKKFAKVDLTSVNALNSPTYYLQQNDVIVVEPNNARVRSSNYNPNNAILISAIGTLTTIVTVLLALRK